MTLSLGRFLRIVSGWGVPRYVFRLDDVAPNMNWDVYFALKDIFQEAGVKPLIGVIPDNRYLEFLSFPECDFDFWGHIRSRQADGWSVALHGYQHLLTEPSGGLLQLSYRGEFAGLPVEAQLEKILSGMDIFKRNGVRADAFMAPSHAFDENTLTAMKLAGITVITDGFAFFPYFRDDVLFVPQLSEKPRSFFTGVMTFCLHPNTMSRRMVEDVKLFISENIDRCIPFSAACEHAVDSNLNLWLGSAAAKTLRWVRSARKAVRH